jgi:hypothetical protein
MIRQAASLGCCLTLLASAAAIAQQGPAPGYAYPPAQTPYLPPAEAAGPYGYPAAPPPPPPAPAAERGSGSPMEKMMGPMGKMTEPASKMTQPMGRMMEPMREMMPGTGEKSGAPAGAMPPGYGQAPPQAGPAGYGYPPSAPPADRESKNPMGQMMAPMKDMMGGEKKSASPAYGGSPGYGYPPGAPPGYGASPAYGYPPAGSPGYGAAPGYGYPSSASPGYGPGSQDPSAGFAAPMPPAAPPAQ